MDVGNLLYLTADLSHDTCPVDCLGAAATTKGQGVGRAFTRTGISPDCHLCRSGECLVADDLARVLLLVLTEAGQGKFELVLALLKRSVVLNLILLPDLVPFFRVSGLIRLGFGLQGKVAFNELEPYLSCLAFNVRRIEFDLSKLSGIVDLDQELTGDLVAEEADVVDITDVLDASHHGEFLE